MYSQWQKTSVFFQASAASVNRKDTYVERFDFCLVGRCKLEQESAAPINVQT